MEDVVNQSSDSNLKFRSIFILIQPNPRVPQRSKFRLPPIQTSSLIFMTVLTQQVYFPTSFCLGTADRFLPVLCVCRGLFGNGLVASLGFIQQGLFEPKFCDSVQLHLNKKLKMKACLYGAELAWAPGLARFAESHLHRKFHSITYASLSCVYMRTGPAWFGEIPPLLTRDLG